MNIMTTERITVKQPCSLALGAAQTAQAIVAPDTVILFGSRARGDYRPDSDIDLMVITPKEPMPNHKDVISTEIQQSIHEAHGTSLEIQLVWRSQELFHYNRRYTNSVETNAIREGIIMPSNPEDYSRIYEDDEETEYEYNWTNYDNRMYHAEEHLDLLHTTVETGKSDLMVGQQAQSALEHSLKALLEAHEFNYGPSYGKTHNIGNLLGTVRNHIPELSDLKLSIEPDIYSEYAGDKEYAEERLNPTLTSQPDFLGRTTTDVEFILDLARNARAHRQ